MYTPDNQNPDANTLYVHSCGVTLCVPREWRAVPRGEGHHNDGVPESGVDVVAPEREGYHSIVTITPSTVQRDEPGARVALEALTEEMVEIIQQHYTGAEIVSHTDIEVTGMPGWAVRYRFEDHERALVFLLRDEPAGLVIRVDLQTIAPLVEDHWPVMLSLVESLERVHPGDLYRPPGEREWSVASAGVSFHAPLDFWEVEGPVDGDGGIAEQADLVLCEEDHELPMVITVVGKPLSGDPEDSVRKYIDAWCAVPRNRMTVDHSTTSGITVDGCPGGSATVRWHDEDHDKELDARTLAVADDQVLAVITVTGELPRAEDIQRVMDGITATARVVAGEVVFPELNRGISLRYPGEWTAELLSENAVRLYSPPSEEHNEYRATLSCSAVGNTGYGLENFERFVEYCGAALAHDGDQIHIVREERRTLPSLEWCHIRWYHRYSEEADLAFTQFQAVVSTGTDGVLLVNAATLRDLEEARLPVLEEILDSLRLVTPG